MGIILSAAAPLGTLAISVMPISYALSIDMGTALPGVVSLLIYAIPQARVLKDQRSSLWAAFHEGVALLRGDAVLWRVCLWLTAVVLALMPSFTLVPSLVKEHSAAGRPRVR